MPHIRTKLKQNKLIRFRDIKSLNNRQQCRKPVFYLCGFPAFVLSNGATLALFVGGVIVA